MNTILVQMSDQSWTLQAIHLACAMACSNQTNIILLRLDYVKHPIHLGTDLGFNPPTNQEIAIIAACKNISEQYGVKLRFESFQCATTVGALVTAADEFFADILFAHIQATHIPFWHKLKTWDLTHRLSAIDCQLFTLDKPAQAPDRPLSITITSVHNMRVK